MRPWRKLHSTILESEHLMDVPLEAKVLFFLLVAAQDDEGYYPWERMKVRRLVATCGWSEAAAKQHADALVTGEMADWVEGGILLRKGKELNGQPRDDRKPFLYQRSSTDMPLADGDSQRGKHPAEATVPLHEAKEAQRVTEKVIDTPSDSGTSVTVSDRQWRAKEIEIETEIETEKRTPLVPLEGDKPLANKDNDNKTPKKRTKQEPLSPEQLAALHQDYDPVFTAYGTGERIADALNHTALRKALSVERYLRGWLRRDAEKLNNANNAIKPGGGSNGHKAGGRRLPTAADWSRIAAARAEAANRPRLDADAAP